MDRPLGWIRLDSSSLSTGHGHRPLRWLLRNGGEDARGERGVRADGLLRDAGQPCLRRPVRGQSAAEVQLGAPRSPSEWHRNQTKDGARRSLATVGREHPPRKSRPRALVATGAGADVSASEWLASVEANVRLLIRLRLVGDSSAERDGAPRLCELVRCRARDSGGEAMGADVAREPGRRGRAEVA